MPRRNKGVWAGRAISILIAFVFLFSAFLKLRGGPERDKGFAHLQIPIPIAVPLAVLEASCAVIYLIPAVSVAGAILVTGYVGGTIWTAWRIGDPVYGQIALGVLAWLGLYLREGRLKALLPVRKKPE